MKKYLSLFLLVCLYLSAGAQQTEIKNYPAGSKAGDISLLYSYGEYSSGVLSRVFVVDVPSSNYYYISSLANMQRAQSFKVYIDNNRVENLNSSTDGWQYKSLGANPVKISAGKHSIKFTCTDAMVPMTEELFLTVNPPTGGKQYVPAKVQGFLDKVEELKSQPVLSLNDQDNANNFSAKVLPNPEGEYAHAIDTAFAYSHFSTVNLTAGNHTIRTSGSTISRILAVFNPNDFAYSWSNVNGAPGGESQLNLIITSPGLYVVMLRPTNSGTSGTTNIILDGSTIVSNAVIGGKYYSMPSVRGGTMNFFTCKFTGGDTRIFVSRYSSSSVRGYNDDYNGVGNWYWGLASRINKNFSGSDSVQYTFVCAFSPTTTGSCDIYMGCGNSNLHQLEPLNFPNLTDDDAIRSAPASNNYNCIAWSGGITTNWIWPPNSLSTYNCSSANYLQCFDNYYNNNPVRYPGAWNYTRTGATETNSIVDLWKTATAYQHASVKKAGNNHPHGYDWESKPGGTNRTFHPRYALANPNWYGSVTSYYKSTGTYARTTGVEAGITSDVDAIKAGLAILDRAMLTGKATDKLSNLLLKVRPTLTNSFEELYKAWDATKAANASFSNPSMYCQNKEYKALEKFALDNRYASMLIVFDKFLKGDHFIGDLLITLTIEKYGKLLDEVKAERLANLYDNAGRYRIHGDHDNGVLYIEKILKTLEEEVIPELVIDAVSISVSPNPVTDKFTVKLNINSMAKVSLVVTSAQTGIKKVLQQEAMLTAGIRHFEVFVKDFAGSSGNILAVRLTVDGVVKTVKIMVIK